MANSISLIAESIGVSVATVIVVSQGYRKSARVQAAIAKALNRRPEEIWPDRYEPEQAFDTRTKNFELRHSQKSPLERHLSELRAERIRRRLRDAGISMKAFSASLGRPSSDVRAVMLGERWSDQIEGEIAKTLNVRAADLWPERYNGSFLSPKHVTKEKIPTSRKSRRKAQTVAGIDSDLVAERKLEKQTKHLEAKAVKAEMDGMPAKAVRYRLLLSGHSCADVAKELNRKVDAVYSAIAGRSKSPRIIENIAQKIGVSFDDLWSKIFGEAPARLSSSPVNVEEPRQVKAHSGSRRKSHYLAPEQMEDISKMWFDREYSSRGIAAATNISLGKLNRTFGPRGMGDKRHMARKASLKT